MSANYPIDDGKSQATVALFCSDPSRINPVKALNEKNAAYLS
jgi:hypothetical protein